MAGLLAAFLAADAGQPTAGLKRYADRHSKRMAHPAAAMGFAEFTSVAAGVGQPVTKLRLLLDLGAYLLNGRAAADAEATRLAYLRQRLAALTPNGPPGAPPDPTIEVIAQALSYLAGQAAAGGGAAP